VADLLERRGGHVSCVTDVVIIAFYDEQPAIDYVNEHLVALDSCEQLLCEIDMDAAGGCKAGSALVWAAAFNYLDTEKFRETVHAAPWQIPGSVTVLIDSEGDNHLERVIPKQAPG
jgi:hypothetical protein